MGGKHNASTPRKNSSYFSSCYYERWHACALVHPAAGCSDVNVWCGMTRWQVASHAVFIQTVIRKTVNGTAALARTATNKTVMWKWSIWLLHHWAEGALSKTNAWVLATKLTLTCQINSISKERQEGGCRCQVFLAVTPREAATNAAEVRSDSRNTVCTLTNTQSLSRCRHVSTGYHPTPALLWGLC